MIATDAVPSSLVLFAYFEIFIFFLSEPGFTGLPDFQDFAYQRCFLMIEPYVYL